MSDHPRQPTDSRAERADATARPRDTDPTADTERRARFADRSFGRHLPFGSRPVLLIVDMMCGFTDPSYDLGADLSAQIEVIESLAATARDAEVPVMHVTSSFSRADLDAEVLWLDKQGGAEALREGTDAVEVDDRLTVAPSDHRLRKRYASAFFATDLVSRLNALDRDTVVVTGCTTSGCVRATAVDAVQYGYVPVVPQEGVGDRDRRAHEASLFDLGMKYADVVSTADVQEYFETGVDPVAERE
jgi:nicotinamidase-related amidase